ncbi:MAG: lipopolysaccharide heptosyltransferase I [Betaproteobacteria bacterium]|nr:lipopolysaccharide heptosyltransferase I [Betaproteobacteria bacterium]
MRVLVVKFSSLGDVIHALPAVTDAGRMLKETITIDWAIEEQYRLLADWHPAVERTIPIALRRWRRMLLSDSLPALRTYLQELRSCTYDAVIDAQGLVKSSVFGVAAARGPGHGFSSRCAREPVASFFYGGGRHFISTGLHMIERIRRLFAMTLGYQLPENTPDYGLPNQRTGQTADNTVLLLHATAQQRKLLAEEKWITIGKMLLSRGLQPELPWGSEVERQRAERIAAAGGGRVLARLPLEEMAAKMTAATGAIGLDTGLTHLAAALQLPCLGLYVATDPKRTGNLGSNCKQLENAGAIDAQQIVATFDSLLAKPDRQ